MMTKKFSLGVTFFNISKLWMFFKRISTFSRLIKIQI